MKIIEYAKAHPWQTGIVVVIGGIVFILISGVFSGDGGESSGSASRPSDAEIQANAMLQAAQIQASSAIQSASIGAGVQLNSDNKAAEVAMRQLDLEADVNKFAIASNTEALQLQKGLIEAQYNAQLQRDSAFFGSLGQLQKKKRDDVIQAYYTGQPYYPQGKGSTANFLDSAGGFVGNLGKAAGSFAQLFSDQRLKENIVPAGKDAKGRNLYDFNYKGSTARRRGYIAQDLQRSNPEMVSMLDNNRGYLTLEERQF